MSRFPPYHVPRRRLTDRCRNEQLVVVEAGAGYGKSVFAAELVDCWKLVGIELTLLGNLVTPSLLAAQLLGAVRRAGFSEAARAMERAGGDPKTAVDEVLAALSAEECAFVIDDVHCAAPAAAELVSYLASRLSPHQRLVVLGRTLPQGAGRLRRAEAFSLGASDLRLLPEETMRISREGFGLDIGAAGARLVDEATGGWTAAVVLALRRSTRTGEELEHVARVAEDVLATRSVAALLEDGLGRLGEEEKAHLAQIGRLPLIDAQVADAVAEEVGFFARAVAAGVPFVSSGGRWWDLPGPVRDVLVGLAPPRRDALRRVAEVYRAAKEFGAALQLLASHGFDEEAAAMIADEETAEIEAVDITLLRAVMDEVSEAALVAHPMALVQLARCCSLAAMFRPRMEALERVRRLVGRREDPALRRALVLEEAKDDVLESRHAAAEAKARAVLAAASPTERVTRASAYAVLGRAVCWRVEEDGRRSGAAMEEADRYLALAVELFRELGLRGAAAIVLPYRAFWVEYARGQATTALRRLQEGLELVADRPQTWASLLLYRYEIELELGRFEECEATAALVSRVASELGDSYLGSYLTWNLSIAASYGGDAAATVELVRRTEQEASDWWTYAAADFLASASESLGRVGEIALSAQYLERAQRDPQDAEPLIAVAEAVLEARAGDPERAEALLLEAPRHRVDPREEWRLTLFRGLAALRRADSSAGAFAARAFEEAARLGLGHLPLVKERSVTESLLGLAIETGLPAALALDGASVPTSIRLLGGFAVARGGRTVELSPGLGPQLVKLLAVNGGRLPAERVIDTLWPDTDLKTGRNRLRTLLTRLRAEMGDLLERDGETLTLSQSVAIDLVRFQSEARRALALGRNEPMLAAVLARSAVTRYRGELLPDDAYEAFVEQPREDARRLMLELLDLAVEIAIARGDLDELRRVVDLTIEVAPYDDERHVRAATALFEQGRRGAALLVLQRARRALEELGLGPSADLVSLEEAISA